MRQHKTLRRVVFGATATALAVTMLDVTGTAHAATERRFTFTGSATGGTTLTPPAIAPGEVQLLTAFDMRYTNGDHHINDIATLPRSDGTLDVEFSDRNGDDPMAFTTRISYAQLPGAIVPPNVSKTCGGGSCTVALQPPPSTNYIFVLRGFSLGFIPDEPGFPFPGHCDDFSGCDHHISDVGIVPGSDSVTVTYADHNADDDYVLQLAYAYIPRTLLAGLTTVNGQSSERSARRTITITGTKAIRGFRMQYVPYQDGTRPDTHIHRLGYLLYSTGITTYFGDADPPTWKYQLMYATFK